MQRFLAAAAGVVLAVGPAWALNGAPGSFADAFNAQAQQIQAKTRVELQICKATNGIACKLSGDHFDLLAEGTATPSHILNVLFVPHPGMSLYGKDDPVWILMKLFSPSYDDVAKSTAMIELSNARSRITASSPAVSVSLGSMQYAWIRVSDGSGELVFRVQDNAPAPVDAVPNTSVSSASQAGPQSQSDPKTSAPQEASSAPESLTAEPPTVTTKEVLTSFSPTDFKIADPEDLYVAPRKFLGKPIEVRHFHCYYADADDYRCVAPGYNLVAVFTSDLEPAAEKSRIENDCGAMKVFLTSKCERTLRIVVDAFDHEQIDMRDRVTLRPKVAIVMSPNAANTSRKKR